MKKFKSCIFIMADGARADLFSELLKNGDLPNISRYIVDKGSYLNAVSVFPSTTGPAYAPYVFGKFPGRCEFPGIRWFDRYEYHSKVFSLKRFRSYIGPGAYFMNRDVLGDSGSIFELIPHSKSILNELSRGVSFGADKTKVKKIYYKIKSHFTERTNEVDESALEILIKSLNLGPDFLYAVFLGIDTYSHITHPFHRNVVDSYIRLDQSIGRVAQKLKSLGKLDETLFVIASDHGLTQTHSHFDCVEFLKTKGYKTLYYPNVFKHYLNASASVMVSGNAMAHLYFKSPDGWGRRSTFEELNPVVEGLVNRREIDIVAGTDHDGTTWIKSKRGEATLSIDSDGRLNYRKIKSDPFGYNGLPHRLSTQECLDKTIDTEYPDALLQIIQLLESRRSGDLIISAAHGYDLRAKHEKPEHRSSHGALLRDHMLVPLAISTKVKVSHARTVDVYPTILKLLGKEVPQGIDGEGIV